MTNYNNLSIEGKEKDLISFKECAKNPNGKSALDFNQFMPYPKRYARLDKQTEIWMRKAEIIINGYRILYQYYKLREIWEKENYYNFFERMFLDWFVSINYTNPYWDIKMKPLEELYKRFREIEGVKNGYDSGGCEWCIEHWGTWNNAIMEESPRKEEDELIYYFSTRGYGAPIPVINDMSKRFPTLEFTLYYVDDWDEVHNSGTYVVEDGFVLLDEVDEGEPFDLIEAELECQTEEDLMKYYEMVLRGE